MEKHHREETTVQTIFHHLHLVHTHSFNLPRNPENGKIQSKVSIAIDLLLIYAVLIGNFGVIRFFLETYCKLIFIIFI